MKKHAIASVFFHDVAEVAGRVAGLVVNVDGSARVVAVRADRELVLPAGDEAGNSETTLRISKTYFATADKKVTITWPQGSNAFSIKLTATGRQVPIVIQDVLTGKGIPGAELKVGSSDVKTDKDGMAKVVLPTASPTLKGEVTANGYVTKTVDVLVTDEYTRNVFNLTPAGKLYFLSNLSGKIDVVKTNLDGTGRETVLAGTGKEDTNTTALLASRDWKYLALLSKRDGNQGIYLINTATDQVTNIDGGNSNATFSLVGWSDDTFIYQVSRSNIQSWQSGAQTIKSYAADSGKLFSLDQTQGEGTGQTDYANSSFGTISILDGEIVYAKNWYGNNGHLTGKNVSFMSVHPDGSGKKSIKDFPIPDSAQYGYTVGTSQYESYSVYVQVPNADNTNTYYQYEDAKLTQASITDDVYNKTYPTYLISPSDKQAFWSDVRDNKNTLFIGNASGGSSKQIASLSAYTPYGWYTDNYLLVSENGSELFVMAAEPNAVPKKITDYYKPQLSYRGYGGGYGGL